MKEAIKFTIFALVLIIILVGIIIWPLHGFITLGILLMMVGFYDMIQKEHSILRNFPVIGHMRYLLEMIGPEIHQYFVESNIDGKPIDRNRRS